MPFIVSRTSWLVQGLGWPATLWPSPIAVRSVSSARASNRACEFSRTRTHRTDVVQRRHSGLPRQIGLCPPPGSAPSPARCRRDRPSRRGPPTWRLGHQACDEVWRRILNGSLVPGAPAKGRGHGSDGPVWPRRGRAFRSWGTARVVRDRRPPCCPIPRPRPTRRR